MSHNIFRILHDFAKWYNKNMHILQSSAWEEFEKLEKNQVFRKETTKYTYLATKNSTPLGNYLYLPYGPHLESRAALSSALSDLKKLATAEKAFFIRIEPTIDFSKAEIQKAAQKIGLKAKKSEHINPEHTWCLDLTVSDDDLYHSIPKNKIRAWKNCQNKGISIKKTKDPEKIQYLTDLLVEISKKDHFIPHREERLRKQMEAGFATLYYAEILDEGEKKIAAANLVFDDGETRYYAHAASNYKYQKYEVGTIVLMEAIMDARKNGAKTFDFWGITTSTDKKHPWYGFTQYKKSFGGYQVDYAGDYDIILNRPKYAFYSLLRKANRIKRRIKH